MLIGEIQSETTYLFCYIHTLDFIYILLHYRHYRHYRQFIDIIDNFMHFYALRILETVVITDASPLVKSRFINRKDRFSCKIQIVFESGL